MDTFLEALAFHDSVHLQVQEVEQCFGQCFERCGDLGVFDSDVPNQPRPLAGPAAVGVEEFELVVADCQAVFHAVVVHAGKLGPPRRNQAELEAESGVETHFALVEQPLVAFLAHAP